MVDNTDYIPQTSPLIMTPDHWLNALWITTRTMSILGYAPIVMGLETEGSPEIIWLHPQEGWVACILDFQIVIDHPIDSKVCLHISENMTESDMLALIGLCTLREATWTMIPAEEADDTLPLRAAAKTAVNTEDQLPLSRAPRTQ